MSNDVVFDWRVATYTGGQGNCVEVGSATRASVPESSGWGRPGRADSQAEPIAGPGSGRASDVITPRLGRTLPVP